MWLGCVSQTLSWAEGNPFRLWWEHADHHDLPPQALLHLQWEGNCFLNRRREVVWPNSILSSSTIVIPSRLRSVSLEHLAILSNSKETTVRLSSATTRFSMSLCKIHQLHLILKSFLSMKIIVLEDSSRKLCGFVHTCPQGFNEFTGDVLGEGKHSLSPSLSNQILPSRKIVERHNNQLDFHYIIQSIIMSLFNVYSV